MNDFIGRRSSTRNVDRGASSSNGRAWADRSHAPSSTVPTRLLPELAARWRTIARRAHASIRAYARLQIALLTLDAPPELVERSARMAAERTRTARLAFGLASAYGMDAGPGALDADDGVERPSLLDVVATAVREGCVGETIASAEAREGAALARDPDVQTVLSRAAEDASTGAALAWAIVRWALRIDSDGVTRVVDDALDHAMRAATSNEDGPDLSDHGLLTARERAALRAELLPSVVRPAWLGLHAKARPAAA